MGWKAVLAIGLAATLGYFWVPGEAGKDVTQVTIGFIATAVVVLAARTRPAGARMGWYLLAAANFCFALGDTVFDVYGVLFHTDVPLPSIADGFYLAGYPFWFVGVARLSRPRRSADSRAAQADAAIVCVGASALLWQSLMTSYIHDGTLSAFGKLVTMAYPVMDLGVLFITAGSMLVGGARRGSDKLLLLSIGAMLVADFAYDLLVLHDHYTTGNPVDAGFLLNYVLLAAAALHPSAASPITEVDESAIHRRRWMPLVSAAGFVSPLILLVSTIAGWDVDVAVLAGTSLLLFALVVTRTALLFTRLRLQAHTLDVRSRSLTAALSTQKDLEADLRHQAFHDHLTGLPNRALLHDRIDQALAGYARSRGTTALFFCDLDGFKTVNDSLGHQAGDELLVVVSRRLAGVVREVDTVARLGGDEFAILLQGLQSLEDAKVLADRVIAALGVPVPIGQQTATVTASVGVAMARSGSTTRELLSQADLAMYEAKASGKNRYVLFDASMQDQLTEELTLKNSFAGSLRRQEFIVEYQPQLGLASGEVTGFEALVRWNHPELGRVEPGRFIALAEATGFVVPLGRWVLETACVEATGWPARGRGPVSVSVNVSACQFVHGTFLHDVRHALSISGLPAEQLVLEITETVLMHDPEAAAATLRSIKALGVRIAIDDFGTGYSSLSYLRRFPVDTLKIDRSFIDSIRTASDDAAVLTESILRLARDMQLDTVAEGVEDHVQLGLLADLGCDSVQGFLVSRPLGAGAAREFLTTARPLNGVTARSLA